MALITLEGSGMIGIPGISKRLFEALSLEKISVSLITQASSEHSLCLAVLPQSAVLAKIAIEEELRYEIKDKLVDEAVTQYLERNRKDGKQEIDSNRNAAYRSHN